MTDAERERLTAYFRLLADRMGLRDWAIEVLDEPADADAHAEVRCVDGRKLAKVRFAHDWRERTPEQMRHNCVHELNHCHFAALWREIERRLKSVDQDTAVMLLEYGIDGIADGWAPSLPLMLMMEGDDMGRQKTAKTLPDKAPAAQPRPKAGPKPAPKGAKAKGAKP